jgi:4'-phosphopantetheinyl transferase EntD
LKSSPMIVSGSGGISISHSKSGGAILVSKNNKNIGIDLEERSRLTEKVLTRVSSETERKSAPNLHFLWPAKEASFKALYPDNDDISIPEVIIQNWEKFEDDIWSFTAHYQEKSIKGFLFSDEILLVAVAFIQP